MPDKKKSKSSSRKDGVGNIQRFLFELEAQKKKQTRGNKKKDNGRKKK